MKLGLHHELVDLRVLAPGRPHDVVHPDDVAVLGGEERGVDRDRADAAAGNFERASASASMSAAASGGKTRAQISAPPGAVGEREVEDEPEPPRNA